MNVENMTLDQLVKESQELLLDITRYADLAADAKRRMDVIQAEVVRREESARTAVDAGDKEQIT